MPTNDLTESTLWDRTWQAKESSLSAWWYRRLRWLVVRRAVRKVGELIDSLDSSPLDILDIGCAPGTTLEYLHRLFPQHRLHGIDYSEEGVAITQQRLRALRIKSMIHLADFQNFEPPQRYDVVLSWGLIEHFRNPLLVVRHHVRLATAGGIVIVTIPNYSAPAVKNLIQRFAPSALETHNLEIMSEPAVRATLQQAGLVQVHGGGVGGPQLRTGYDPTIAFGRVYNLLARAWNLTISLLPAGPLGWQSTIWGCGRVPLSAKS